MTDTEIEKLNSSSHPPSATAESADESDDESDVLEESPCGRWQKRREEVCIFFFQLLSDFCCTLRYNMTHKNI